MCSQGGKEKFRSFYDCIICFALVGVLSPGLEVFTYLCYVVLSILFMEYLFKYLGMSKDMAKVIIWAAKIYSLSKPILKGDGLVKGG